MIVLNEIKLDRIPFTRLEFDNSLVGAPSEQPYRALVLGTSDAGAALQIKPTRIATPKDSAKSFLKAPIAEICDHFLKNNKKTPLYAFDFPPDAKPSDIASRLELLKKYGQFNIVISQWSDGPTLKALAAFYDKMGAADLSAEGIIIAARSAGYGELLDFTESNTLSFKYLMVVASPVIDYTPPAMPSNRPLQPAEGETPTEAAPAPRPSRGGNRGNANAQTEAQKKQYPDYLIAAAVAAQVAHEAQIDPARPFNTLPLDIPAFAEEKAFDRDELNNLVGTGLSVYSLSYTGQPLIERLVTTWTKDDSGLPDDSYSDLNTMLISSYLRYSFVAHFHKKFVSRRYKLADDTELVPPGALVVQPKTAKAEAVNLFSDWQLAGLVENAKAFTDSLLVEKKGKYLLFSFNADYIESLLGIGAKLYLVR